MTVTVTNLGTTGPGTITGTTTPFHLALGSVTAVSGQLILVTFLVGSSRPYSSVTDSGGNSYTQVNGGGAGGSFGGAAGALYMAYCANPTGFTGSITVSWLTADDAPIVNAIQISGLTTTSVLDQIPTSISDASGSLNAVAPPWTTGTVTQNNEIVIAFLATSGNAGTYVADGARTDGFFNANKMQQGGGGSLIALDYKILTTGTTTGTSYAPSWVNANRYTAGGITLNIAAIIAGSTGSRRSLLGVGR